MREYPCFLESVGSDTAGVYVSLSRVVDPPVAFRDRSLAPRPNWSRWRLVHTVTQCHISQGESESTQAVTTRLLRVTTPEGHILLVLAGSYQVRALYDGIVKINVTTNWP